MLEFDLHDLSDDADYADSMQQGSESMTRSGNSNRNSSSEQVGAEIVYFKDNVAIHPTQHAWERIRGRLKLIKQGGSLSMTWIPYEGQSSSARLSEKDKSLYTIRAVPFSDIRSICRHTPTLGWQYAIVVLSSGLAFPPFYFYNGGLKEFLATIKQYVFLVRSAEDANIFLVNDLQDPLQRTLSSLELPGAVSVANSPTSSIAPSKSSFSRTDGEALDKNSAVIQQNGRQRQKHNDPRHLSIQVLEKFSLVTRFARETKSQFLREAQGDGFISNAMKKHDKKTNNYSSVVESNDVHKPLEDVHVPANSSEESSCEKHNKNEEAAMRDENLEYDYDKLSLVWGKPRQPPLGSEEWSTFLDSEGRIVDSQALRKRIFYGGVEKGLRKEVWRFLLGYHSYDSTYSEREYLASIRKSEYETIKNQWKSITKEQAKRFTKFRERKALIEKDVVRTDRSIAFYDGDDNSNVKCLRDILLTYSFYNFDLGYCQGMSDLLSPILYVMGDESQSFWCFVALMERLGPNFNRDQNGVHSQLFALSKLVELLDNPLHNYFQQKDCLNYFFCFRWVLIQFKREFDFEKTMRLWEVLWTHYLSEHLHLYVCVAILRRHRSKIIGEEMDFDTLLKFINELSGHINLDATLREAEALCICAGENGEACIPPGTPPSLPFEITSMYNQQDDDDIL
uniref:TBC1 domain family member 15 n=1 Tax=Solanum lycopersicum TaxID=4081 RepID=A0A3Q7H4Q2_SOLLC|nr:GTPase-activating protein gyp7 [Solanum lycopersicum]